MEACGMAHYWGRVALRYGHRVTLVPPAYVRPYVRRNKTDRADAEAILETVRSGQVPSVPVKRVEQQAELSPPTFCIFRASCRHCGGPSHVGGRPAMLSRT
jgi:transposase